MGSSSSKPTVASSSTISKIKSGSAPITEKCLFHKKCGNITYLDVVCISCKTMYGEYWKIRIRSDAIKATAKYYIEWEVEDLAKLLTEDNITTDLEKFKRKFFPIGSIITRKDGTYTVKFEMFRLHHLKLYQLIYPPDDSINPYIAEQSQRLVDERNQKLARYYFEARKTDVSVEKLKMASKNSKVSYTTKLLYQSEIDKMSKKLNIQLERVDKYLDYLSDKQPSGFEDIVQSLLQEMITESNNTHI